MADMLVINRSVRIRQVELHIRTTRSSGHGGQNVNKVETSVEILFDVKHSSSLTEADRQMILERLSNRIDSRGILHVQASESRSQWQNRVRALSRLALLLKGALKKTTPRIATHQSTAGKERRLQEKKRKGKIKALRRVRPED
jgi:ribosome-associated protein